jgi:hypothetical protein
MQLYKFTHPDYTTRNDTVWGRNVTHKIHPDLRTPQLCTDGVIHAYKSPYQAVIFGGYHRYEKLLRTLWLAEGEVVVEDLSKVGCYEITTIRCIEEPLIPYKPAVRELMRIILSEPLTYCRNLAVYDTIKDRYLSGEFMPITLPSRMLDSSTPVGLLELLLYKGDDTGYILGRDFIQFCNTMQILSHGKTDFDWSVYDTALG